MVHPGGNEPWCGGSLVSSQHVLTAAHCTHGHTVTSVELLVGEHDTTDEVADRHTISAIIPHPSYNHTSADFDFAILTLENPVDISDTVGLVCLPDSASSLYTDSVATVTGWGDTSSEGPSPSITLQDSSH